MSTINMFQSVTPTFGVIPRDEVQACVIGTINGSGFECQLIAHTKQIRKTIKTGDTKSRWEGQKCFDTYRLSYPIVGPAGEQMVAQLRVSDSTLPGQAFRVELGLFRLVCLNGLFAFDAGEQLARITHRIGPTAQDKLDVLADTIMQALKQLPQLSNQAAIMAAIPVQQPIEVLKALNIPASVRSSVEFLILSKKNRSVDNPTNVWGLYNLINEVDRLHARKGSIAYLERDTNLVDQIIEATQVKAA